MRGRGEGRTLVPTVEAGGISVEASGINASDDDDGLCSGKPVPYLTCDM